MLKKSEGLENPNRKIHFSKAFEDGLKLFVFGYEHLHDYFTDLSAQGSDVCGEEIFEISRSCLLHQIVSRIIAKKNQKDRSHIMKSLNILQIFIFGKETI